MDSQSPEGVRNNCITTDFGILFTFRRFFIKRDLLKQRQKLQRDLGFNVSESSWLKYLFNHLLVC